MYQLTGSNVRKKTPNKSWTRNHWLQFDILYLYFCVYWKSR